MTRTLAWTDEAWSDYLYWQGQDKKTLKRINKLIEAVLRNPFDGIGKPEPLKENLTGFWSRRIDDTHRLLYAVEDEYLTIIACRYHYTRYVRTRQSELDAAQKSEHQCQSAGARESARYDLPYWLQHERITLQPSFGAIAPDFAPYSGLH
jgi:toxin YoeB